MAKTVTYEKVPVSIYFDKTTAKWATPNDNLPIMA